MATIETQEVTASGTDEIWIALRAVNGTGEIYGFFDVPSVRALKVKLTVALDEIDANKEKLEDFNDRRFHPTGKEPK